MEDEAHRLGPLLGPDLLRNVLLRSIQDGGLKHHVAWLIDTMHIAKGGRDREETVRDLGQSVVDLEDFLRLGVQILRVGVLIVHAILLSSGDPQFHLQAAADLRHPLHVLHTNFNVLLQRLLRQVQHVRGEQRLAMELEISLIRFQEAIKPWKQTFCAVVRVQDDGDAVLFGNSTHVVRTRNSTSYGRMKLLVVQALPGIELRAARGELDHDRRVHLSGCLDAGVDGRGRHTVHCRNCVAVLLGMVQQVDQGLARHNSWVHRLWELRELPHGRVSAREHWEPLLIDGGGLGSARDAARAARTNSAERNTGSELGEDAALAPKGTRGIGNLRRGWRDSPRSNPSCWANESDRRGHTGIQHRHRNLGTGYPKSNC
mmetsp:Transcript_35808/g.66704  ORF Transcript_35808/g.66704 Transcript_35808/m.66704 type:complete len:373 (+) Transcript_35808:485-1603(+)